jgi:hypothetical protein
MILGIVGLVCCSPAGIAALVLGLQGRRKVQEGRATNGGQALAGIILGSIGIVVMVAEAVGVGLHGR